MTNPTVGPALPSAPAWARVSPQDDLLCPHPAIVRSIEPETPGVATFRLEFQDRGRQERYRAGPGQFNMIYVPGVGEVPISVSGAIEEGPGIGHTIRFAGRVTRVIGKLGPGAIVGMRGPYGRGWPMEQAHGRDVVVVAGGLGLAPLRLVVKALLADRDQFGRLTLVYGARNPADLLYTSEYPEWERRGMELLITVDRADLTWQGRVGVVPVLFNRLQIDPERTVVLTCGPEILMRFAVSEAMNRGVSDRDIYYSMERNMQCAVGLCGHCQFGPAFLCKDGPVFAHRQLAPFLSKEMF
ncbi:MAG: FAD/NAD(P)-binding protein [Isosphaerales bacterium]